MITSLGADKAPPILPSPPPPLPPPPPPPIPLIRRYGCFGRLFRRRPCPSSHPPRPHQPSPAAPTSLPPRPPPAFPRAPTSHPPRPHQVSCSRCTITQPSTETCWCAPPSTRLCSQMRSRSRSARMRRASTLPSSGSRSTGRVAGISNCQRGKSSHYPKLSRTLPDSLPVGHNPIWTHVSTGHASPTHCLKQDGHVSCVRCAP